jgi:hypothetical protein
MHIPCRLHPLSVSWHNQQPVAHLVLRPKPRNRHSYFETQITKLKLPVLWPKLVDPKPPILRPNREKPSMLVLRTNQETHAPYLLVHGADRTQHHPISRSSGHQVPDLCLTIPDPLHLISYSCHDPRCYPPCRTYHQHTRRQANTILHTR